MYRPLLKITVIFLLLFSTLNGFAEEKGRLWKVVAPQQQVTYLFGTMHSEDPRVIELPADVNAAFAGATSVTLEMEMNAQAMLLMTQKMFLPQGQELVAIIGDELYGQVVNAMQQHGMPVLATARMKPWVALITLSLPPPKTGLFLDMLLYQRAIDAGKIVYGLESAEEQIAVFEEMSLDDQLVLLRETLRLLPELPDFYEKLTRVYLAGDLAGLMAKSEQSYLRIPREINARVMHRLLVERNDRMVERMQPRLHEGGAFIAVGALHLPGANGILQQLRDQGFQVSAVH